MRSPGIACSFMLAVSVAVMSGCSRPSQVQTPPVARVSTTVVDASAPLSTEDSATLEAERNLKWEGHVPESFSNVRSLVATAPWAIYPTQTFGRRLLGIFYAKDVPEEWGDPRADYATLVYEGGVEVQAARHQYPGITTFTGMFHTKSQTGDKAWGDIVQVGPFSAILSEYRGDNLAESERPKTGAVSVEWIADDVIYRVQSGAGSRGWIQPSTLSRKDVLAMARSAVRAPKRITPDPSARADAPAAALLRSLEASGGRLLPDNFAALRLFPYALWPEDTLGRRLVAIVYNRIPPRFRERVSASGRGPVSTLWYPRLTLIYENGLTVSEELDELKFEGLGRDSGFSVKQPTDALGTPAYVGPGRLEFMPFDVRYTIDAPQLDQEQLERVGRSMHP